MYIVRIYVKNRDKTNYKTDCIHKAIDILKKLGLSHVVNKRIECSLYVHYSIVGSNNYIRFIK